MLVGASDEYVCILEVVSLRRQRTERAEIHKKNTMQATALVVSQSALRRLPLRLIDANTKLKLLLTRPCTSLYLNEAIFDLSNGRLKFDFLSILKRHASQARVHIEKQNHHFFLFRLSPESSLIVVANLLLLLLLL